MKQPPYHLKVNKAIDRLLLVDILNRLNNRVNLSNYTYYGFGGPFLEDCRLIHDQCPEIQIVSIEKKQQIFKRQEFHCFSKKLNLVPKDLTSFLANFSSNGGEIFWLDYTDLKFANFDEFMSILGEVSENSIVKITIRAEPLSKQGLPLQERNERLERFQEEYDKIIPELIQIQKKDIENTKYFIKLLQEMLEMAAQEALRESESVFQPLNSSYYRDQTQMLSVTGMVCKKDKVSEIRKWFKNWPFVNLTWENAHKIDVPILSIKERLHLEKHIPTTAKTGRFLSRSLGYRIDDSEKKHIEKLKQYEEFYQYYPYFARVSI